MEIKRNDKNQIFCKCNQCGNYGYLDIKGEYKETYYDEDYNGGVPNESLSYYMLECPVCFKPVIVRGWFLYFSDMKEEELDLLYPADGFKMRHTPKPIQEQYFNTRECFRRKDYGLCLASLRILLEKIAVDKGAVDNTLEKKIEGLARKNIIPLTIKNASTILRKLGNKGAHGNEELVAQSDIDMLFEFVENIISYIYELPTSISTLSNRYP